MVPVNGPTVLVTGAGGMLGRALTAHLAGRRCAVVAAGRAALDVTCRDAVIDAVAGAQVVVHAAAWTAVDDCEADPDRAYAVNALGTRHVAEACRRAGAHLVYLSTDYVFDGTSPRPYTEWDDPNPLSVYGRSKLGGEGALDPGWTVVRTSWLFGAHGPNIVRTVAELAARGRPMRFVDDQRGCPTATADLAPVVAELALGRRPGVFHVTNQGPTTWYGLAREVVLAAGLDPGLVEPIATADLDPPRAAARPANSVLDNAALRLSGLPALPEWRDAVRGYVKELVG